MRGRSVLLEVKQDRLEFSHQNPLLKSAIYPNPEADKEQHEFCFTLLPHLGGWREAGTIREAYLLNNPLMSVFRPRAQSPSIGRRLPESFSFVESDRDNIVIEVVKKAEDGPDWIVRLYECFNRRTPVRLTFALSIAHAVECDLMENDAGDPIPAVTGGPGNRSMDLVLRPYDIRTIRIRFRMEATT